MVAQEDELAVLVNEFEALVRIRSVADDVSKAKDLVDLLFLHVGKYLLKLDGVPVDVR